MNYKQSLFLMHLVILIWGFTGILGKLLTSASMAVPNPFSTEQLVWFRMLIGALSIGAFVWIKPKTVWPSRKQVWQLLGVGVIIALHWLTFFGSIKVSNVSIALACLSSISLFTALLEPIFFKRKIQFYEVLLGVIVIGALVLIFKFETQFQLGIILSVITAFLASLFTTINGKFAQNVDSVKVSLFEIGGGWVVLSFWMIFNGDFSNKMFDMSPVQIWSIIALGTVCTAFAFIAGVAVMKKLSPFTVSLSTNLEPIYSILLASYFFLEHKYLTIEFYIGASIILGTVVVNAIIKAQQNRKAAVLAH